MFMPLWFIRLLFGDGYFFKGIHQCYHFTLSIQNSLYYIPVDLLVYIIYACFNVVNNSNSTIYYTNLTYLWFHCHSKSQSKHTRDTDNLACKITYWITTVRPTFHILVRFILTASHDVRGDLYSKIWGKYGNGKENGSYSIHLNI